MEPQASPKWKFLGWVIGGVVLFALGAWLGFSLYSRSRGPDTRREDATNKFVQFLVKLPEEKRPSDAGTDAAPPPEGFDHHLPEGLAEEAARAARPLFFQDDPIEPVYPPPVR